MLYLQTNLFVWLLVLTVTHAAKKNILSFAFVQPAHGSSFLALSKESVSRSLRPKSITKITTLTVPTTARSAVALSSDAAPSPSSLLHESYLKTLSSLQSSFTRVGLASFIIGMCLLLPITLFPQMLLYRLGALSRLRKERWALLTSQWCARTVLRLIPFCRITTINDNLSLYDTNPEPTVWTCNHISMLDVFLLLAADKKLRGKNRRPIKIVYWKQLEDHPVTRLVFKQCGFIPVQMADNGSGVTNDYDKSSFKQLLKDAKQALAEGFDLGILPEGQLNPAPEVGVLPIYSGAFTLARMSRRPIRMMALFGADQLWHATKGLICQRRQVRIRVYPPKQYEAANEFVSDFETIVGHFGMHGTDFEPPPALAASAIDSNKKGAESAPIPAAIVVDETGKEGRVEPSGI